MTQDEIISLAREAGAFRNYFDYGVEGFAFVNDETLERFAALVAAHEREACLACYSPDDTATDLADKIRKRNEK